MSDEFWKDPARIAERLHAMADEIGAAIERGGIAQSIGAFPMIRVGLRDTKHPDRPGFVLVVGIEPEPAKDDDE